MNGTVQTTPVYSGSDRVLPIVTVDTAEDRFAVIFATVTDKTRNGGNGKKGQTEKQIRGGTQPITWALTTESATYTAQDEELWDIWHTTEESSNERQSGNVSTPNQTLTTQ